MRWLSSGAIGVLTMIDSPRPFLSWVVFKSGCCFSLWMLCRSVAVELEVTKELSKLLYSVESAYLGIVREVAAYAVEHNVTSAIQLRGLFYSKYRGEYPGLHSHLVIQAIRQPV